MEILDIENELTEIIKNEASLTDLSKNDDFFDLNITSMQLFISIYKYQSSLGLDFGLEVLSHGATIEAVSKHIHSLMKNG